MVTLELHVHPDLGDDDVLKLTRWAWEKCAGALGGGRLDMGKGVSAGAAGTGVGDGPEVTVGVVRG